MVFPAVYVSGAVDCLPLCAAVGGSVERFGACLYPCTLARLRGSVRPLWRLWAAVCPGLCCGSVHRPGVAAVALSSVTEKSPGKLYKLHPGAKEPPPGLHPGRLYNFIYSFSAIRTESQTG